jgi:class 3 adenylate cyclase
MIASLRSRLAELNARGWPGGLSRLEVGIGINSGPMIAEPAGERILKGRNQPVQVFRIPEAFRAGQHDGGD